MKVVWAQVSSEFPMATLSTQVNADAIVAIEAEVTSSEDLGAIAVWTLTDGVLDGYDDLSLAVSSRLEYEVGQDRSIR